MQGLAILGPTLILFFASNKILNIKVLVNYCLLTIANKAVYDSCPLPTPVMNLFCISEPPNINIFLKFSHHGSLYGSIYPSVMVPKLWSLEALGIWNIHKLEAFKSELYSRLVEGYSKEVTCDNPFCEDCS